MKKGVLLFAILVAIGSLSLSRQSFAQTRAISGKVTSSDDGQPVVGATVVIKGTNKGTATDGEGNYSIDIPEGNQTLVFRFVGMIPQEVQPTGNTLNVALKPDVTQLQEMVVTFNGIRREKRALGYSAPTINAEELMQGQSTSPLNALAGKIAGVNITTTAAAPNSSSRIVLRGGSSITGNNQALMVVDGIPIDNTSKVGGQGIGGISDLTTIDFGNRGNDINPTDIASVTVLKGPAAAALYGSRASNGAIIITTKRGTKGQKKNEVIVNSSVTFSNILKLPDYQNEYGQGWGGVDPKENGSWGDKFDGQVREWGQEIDGVRQKKPYVALKDNVKDFFETGAMYNNNVAFSGGGEKTSYYLSLNSLNSDGPLPGNSDNYDKYGARFNGTADLSNKFSSSISIGYNKISANVTQGGQGGGSVWQEVIQTPRDIPLSSLGDLSNKYNSFGSYVDDDGVLRENIYGYYGAYTQNPYYVLKNYKNLDDLDRVVGSISISYKPLDWLSVVERVGVDAYSDRRRLKYPKYRVAPADVTSGNYSAADNTQVSNGKYEEDNYNLNEITNDLMVTAEKQFSSDFHASLMVGHNVRQRTYTESEVSTNVSGGLVVPDWYNLDNSNGPVSTYNRYEQRRLVGVYSELNLDYKEMLFLGATARNDWSSTLPQQHNSFFYPSVNGSFVFTELLKGTGFGENILNYGKVRASWAQVGNDADPYLLSTVFTKTILETGFVSGVGTFPFNNIPGITQDKYIGNPDLKPEITSAYEVGTELNFLNSRLSVDFSYYRNRSKNQILNIPISTTTGFEFKSVNGGVVENRGIELSLRGIPVQTTSGLTVELYGTYTRNHNEVVSLMEGVKQVVIGGFNGMSIVAAVGQPYGTFYAQDLARDDQGRVIVADNGLPKLTDSSVYLGSYNPKYQASWGASVRYKGWGLNLLFETKQGGKFHSQTKSLLEFVGASAETGGNRDPEIWPNSVYENGEGKYVENTQYKYQKIDYYSNQIPAGQDVVDASYIRLQEASLTYHLPTRILDRTPFGDLAIGIFGNNLLLWTAKQNQFVDPEVNSAGAGNVQGFDFRAQPSLRNYGVNLKVTF
ncbi:SusC/RagA family TonB-linked outer membrane protein [Compostibacter hankyongensis]|uniref:SusC/RagA family TonB-linked outer membrane protein n=1 Tax=Compostibacter hankyongensis TaxID=1007089 RepID=A0ABP8FY17_9BACT